MKILTWNLYQGRDHPPGARYGWASKLLRRPERLPGGYVQLNADLRRDFQAALAAWDWDVALLQEAPPSWLGALARATRSHGVEVLSGRNSLPALRRRLKACNPDVVGAAEGGSNQILVRAPWRVVQVERRTLSRHPDTRRLIWVALDGPFQLAVANQHLSTQRAIAEAQARDAAGFATTLAAGRPVVLGGDFNLRAANSGGYERLERELGLTGATASGIDQLLSRGLQIVRAPHALPARAREFDHPLGRVRLSDHDAVQGEFGAPD